MMNQPNGLSVTVITWNRAEILRRSLEAFTQVSDPGLPWELIVVDNGSKDHTREVIDSFASRLPIIYQCEPKPGTCEARNCGIRSSHYDFTIFTDDDITPSKQWLCAYAQAVIDHPDASYFGGTIELDLSACQVPNWMMDSEGHLQPWIGGQLAQFTPAQIARIGLAKDGVNSWIYYGGNMAYRKSMFERYGLFDPRLGHTRKRRFALEEPFFQRRLFQAGEKPCYVEKALVWHRIRPDELTFRSRWRWSLSRGRAGAVSDFLTGDQPRINSWRLRRTIKNTVKSLPALVSRDQFRRLQTITELTSLWAYEVQMLRLFRTSDQ